MVYRWRRPSCQRWHYDILYIWCHKSDVIMSAIASQITGVSIVQSQIKENIKTPRHWSLRARGINLRLAYSPHKGPITRKMFPFDDVIMAKCNLCGRMGHRIIFTHGTAGGPITNSDSQGVLSPCKIIAWPAVYELNPHETMKHVFQCRTLDGAIKSNVKCMPQTWHLIIEVN